MIVQDLRAQFPIFSFQEEDWIYLDNAATTFKPQSVIQAIRDYDERETATVHRSLYALSESATQKQHQARKKVQSYIGAASEKEILFTSGTTASINLVALSFGEVFVLEGDEILISEIEHHSNLVPWQMLAHRKKAHLRVIPVLEDASLDLEALKSLLNPKTKLVALPHVSNAFGVENPIQEIVQLVRAHSKAKILVDGAQSISHLPIDVQKLDVDFFAFSAHKMYGPTGVGVLYGKEALLEQMPPCFGGGDMIDRVSFEKTTYNELPYKFESGTPNISGIWGLGAAIDFINVAGLDSIAQKEYELCAMAYQELKEIKGIHFLGQPEKKSALLSFWIEDVHPLDVATLLNLEKIALRSGHLCVQPGLKRFSCSSVLRISFACYNTKQEVEFFVQALKNVLKAFKS